MGDDVGHRVFTRQDRRAFREKVQLCLDAMARMLADDQFELSEPRIGMEVELNLVDAAMRPAMANTEVLEAIADDAFQTELGRFNIEINVPPHRLRDRHVFGLEESLRASLNSADARAARSGSRLAMVGILPTLRAGDLTAQSISANPRYALLNNRMLETRGEDIELRIVGTALPGAAAPERLETVFDSILPEAACTSLQLHLQVGPDEFAAHWNAAQAIAGVQVALAANSPFLIGKALWHETRLPLFQQATDTRPQELVNQGVRPRVWFGERWITSIFDLFEENSRYFPSLLPIVSDEDPLAVLDAGGDPALTELRMHNGTIYRWNRPIYDTTDGGHHIRLENRVLPAGPTVVDTIADALFFYGTVRAFVDADRPLWSQMSFDAARENLESAARSGFAARLYWPEVGWVSPQELVLRRLLPMAHAGLAAYGVAAEVRAKYLGVIEARCLAGRTGADWQRSAVAQRERAGEDRPAALAGMLADYLTLMGEGTPVHGWEL
ncbi:glutamate-cysteine ligase family protein [Tomitella gaofuii]|uniref:glutamate-cysteine ligase family protein n=1 Tax=Tomitella gaofuii TaxID=2760083 RepID=UPI0015F8493D|nr:glutamate-cysteine ligase family protein [Tomitella gaofuii]